MWRKVVSLLVACGAVAALYQAVVVPWRCNLVEAQVSRATPDNAVFTDRAHLRSVAKKNVELLLPCLHKCRSDANLSMLAGANLMRLGRVDAAAGIYKEALRFDQRPELFAALASAQAQLGDDASAIANAVTAANFAGVGVLSSIGDVEVRARATEIVGEREEKRLMKIGMFDLANLVTNGTFDDPGPSAKTQIIGYGSQPSAAAAWDSINPYGESTTSIVPSTRRPGGNAIHVVTSREVAGLRQVWSNHNYVPRVRTSAWVFVKRGRVSIGSGNGAPIRNAESTTTGRWEKIEGINVSCPATLTMIQAASPDGADFIVDEVYVRRTLVAPPCAH